MRLAKQTSGRQSGWFPWMAAGCLTVLLCAQVAAGSVIVRAAIDCTQRPRIVVMLDGRPVASAVVQLFRGSAFSTRPRRVGGPLKTNGHGEVRLPALSPGNYSVEASLQSESIDAPDMAGNVELRYIPKNADPADYAKLADDPAPLERVMIDLEPWSNQTQSIPEKAREAAGKPIADRAPDFGGVVVDAVGTLLSNVTIRVVRMHEHVPEPVRTLKTDAEGHFWAKFPDGDYLAWLDLAGFKEGTLTVTIDSTAAPRELRVLLKVGDMTE